MSRAYKLFIGQKIREIRTEVGLTQAEFAKRLGISTSYFNQIENNQRHVTAGIILALAEEFNVNVARLSSDDSDRLLADLTEVLADPIFDKKRPSVQDIKLVAQNAPGFIHALMSVHSGLKKADEQLAELDRSIVNSGTGVVSTAYEEVRDFFHYEDNYIDVLDRAAEKLAESLDATGTNTADKFSKHLEQQHNVKIVRAEPPTTSNLIRAFDPSTFRLVLNASLPRSTQAFQLAFQTALLEHQTIIDDITDKAGFQSQDAAGICSIGLANYFAGAAILPYSRFADSALEQRNDIDALANMFGASLEQVAHRLSTLQRPGEKGVPFFFAKLDQAGNIAKRHSATKLQFARFGAACPLWNAHRAFETPNRFIRQLAETPDGTRYVCIAIEVCNRPMSYRAPTSRFALAMGCEVKYADQFVYADDLDTQNPEAYSPIGVSCRICDRKNCLQRVVPPLHGQLLMDMNRRECLPYRLV